MKYEDCDVKMTSNLPCFCEHSEFESQISRYTNIAQFLRDFNDVIEALKHVVTKLQASRFGVIILIYDKNTLPNADIIEKLFLNL